MLCERARLESRGTAELSSTMRREAGGWGYISGIRRAGWKIPHEDGRRRRHCR